MVDDTTLQLYKAPDGDNRLIDLPSQEVPGTVTLASGSPFKAFQPVSVNVGCFMNKGSNLLQGVPGIGPDVLKLLANVVHVLVDCDISVTGDNGFQHTCHYNAPDVAGSGLVNPVPVDKYGLQPCTFDRAPLLKTLTFQVVSSKFPNVKSGTLGDIGGLLDTIVVVGH